jgi:hypothetical protein
MLTITVEEITMKIADALSIIYGYISVKQKEKDIKSIVDLNKASFITACDVVADGKNQIEIGGAVLYTAERKKYEYSKAILDSEKRLKALKEKFETVNEPVEVTRCWAVKL